MTEGHKNKSVSSSLSRVGNEESEGDNSDEDDEAFFF